MDLINKIKNVDITPRSRLISFDICNLYTNIPINDALHALQGFLAEQELENNEIEDLIKLYHICLQQNFFTFNETIYVQPDGLTMGCPLSGLMADLFVEKVEEKIFTLDESIDICFWGRYVDDIFMIWNGDHTQLQILFQKINNVSKLKFTMETEITNKLNFLDLTITRHDSYLKYSIYRKPTATDIIIPNHSQHHPSIKMAAFRYYLDRLQNIPMEQTDMEEEYNIIKTIARNNGYNDSIIDQIHRKSKLKRTIQNIYPHVKIKNKNYRKLTYHPTLDKRINKIMRDNKITTTTNTNYK